MAAVCVQAIWTASAPSISSLGATASIIASVAFMESSEIPPKGERHAACIWNKLAFTKSLDVVPRALFSRRHQFLASPSGGWTFASLPSARHTLTRTGGRRRWPAIGAGELFGLFIRYPVGANNCTKERSHVRSSIASAVQFPLRKFPFFVPRGAPGLSPPCKRHRLRPRMAGRWHAAPARVSAPHRGACLRLLRRLSRSWSMGLSVTIFMPLLRGMAIG